MSEAETTAPPEAQPSSEAAPTPTTGTADTHTESQQPVPDWAKGVPENLRRGTQQETIEALTDSYKNAVDLAKGRRARQGLSIEPTERPTATPATSLNDIFAAAGLDRDAVEASIKQSGTLTGDQFASLESAGYHRDLVGEFIQAKRSAAEANARVVTEAASAAAGGAEALESLIARAGAKLSDSQLSAYNTLIGKGTPESVSEAVFYLKSALGEGATLQQPANRPVDATSSSPARTSAGYANQKELAEGLAEFRRRASQGQDTRAIQRKIAATPASIKNEGRR
ncbi:MAG: hypothetical protein AAGB51_12405 [Planctomycetota bacterium]